MKSSLKRKNWLQLVGLLLLCIAMFFANNKWGDGASARSDSAPAPEATSVLHLHEITGQVRFF